MQTSRERHDIFSLPSWRKLMLFGVLSCLLAGFSLNPAVPPTKTPDSLHYLDAATRVATKGEYGDDYLLWPPLYPTILAPGVALGLEDDFGYLNFFLLASTILISMLLAHLLGAGSILAALAGVSVGFSSPTRMIFGTLWSETLFLPLTLAWLLNWSRYLARYKDADLAWACIFMGLCLLTRHVSVTLVGTMLATLLWRCRHKLSWNSLLKPLAAIGLSMAPYLLWLWRTYIVSGTLTGPRPPQFLPFETLLLGLPSTLSHWLLPSIYLTGRDPWAITVSVGLILIPFFAAIRILHSNDQAHTLAHKKSGCPDELALTSLVFIAGYFGFLVWAVRSTYLEVPRDRYLAPVFVPLLLLILFASRHWEAKIGLRSERLAHALRATGLAWLLAEIILP